MLNRFRIEQGRCAANLHKWRRLRHHRTYVRAATYKLSPTMRRFVSYQNFVITWSGSTVPMTMLPRIAAECRSESTRCV